jgi:uncharacterized membrane protein YhaH (DUF805 family)
MNARSLASCYRKILSRAPRIARIFFGLDGRINRARYWLYLGLAIPMLALFREADVAFAGLNESTNVLALRLAAVLAESLAGVIIFVTLAAGAAMTVKRLHDRDKSGTWIAHFVAAPVLLYWLGQLYLDAHLERVHSLPFLLQFVALFVSVWSFVELCCRRGTVGPNRFGPDRLQPNRRENYLVANSRR